MSVVFEFLAGMIGEELFRKIAGKRYAVLMFFFGLFLLIQLLIVFFLLLISVPSLFDGYYSDKPISVFFIDFMIAIVFESQPYALLFSAFIALLGTLSYLWHRKFSHHHPSEK